MKISPSNFTQMTLSCLILLLISSCNKDSDLLAEYVVEENPVNSEPKEVILDLANAVFTIDEDQPVSFNMLNNTTSDRKGRRKFKSSVKPRYGKITIERDSIAVYTPSSDYNGKDNIEITLEETNEDETTSEVVITVDVTVEPVTDVVEDIIEVPSEATPVAPIVIEPLENDTFNKESEVIITEVSSPANGIAVINEDNTITYTPNTNNSQEETPVVETPKEDTFTYTTSVTNPDNTVTEETGSVIVTVAPEAGKPGNGETVTLNSLKAFPSAFGAGQHVTGGRGGKLYFVTNLNDSGPGSFREAYEATGNRVIVIKVEGRVNLSSPITPNQKSNGNVTVVGQTAPGYGLTLSGSAITNFNNGNIVIRHLTIRNRDKNDYSPFGMREIPDNSEGGYIDHLSLGWSTDQQTLDILSRFASNKFTIAHNLLAEGTGTGGILGDSGSGASPAGDYTISRNMFYNITHRFFNMSGSSGNFQQFNNYIVNWQGRLSVTSGGVHVDWFNNYADKGNHSKSSSIPVNKASYDRDFRTYTGFNYVEGVDENPVDNQTSLWVNYKSNADGADNAPLASYHYVSARQFNFEEPSDGVWNVFDVPSKVTNTVGHNRGADSNGNPVFLRDALDGSFINKSLSGSTEATYRSVSAYTYPSLSSGYSAWKDSDSDGMADTFEDAHGLDKNNPADGLQKKLDWNFETYNVINNAGYYNREIYWAYLANDFEIMLGLSNN